MKVDNIINCDTENISHYKVLITGPVTQHSGTVSAWKAQGPEFDHQYPNQTKLNKNKKQRKVQKKKKF